MEFGLFLMPSHPPERPIAEGQEWDLQMIRWGDEYGFSETWVGEHYSDLGTQSRTGPSDRTSVTATERIRLGPGGFILPYHHPMELANRIAFLDHLAGGRFNLAYPVITHTHYM